VTFCDEKLAFNLESVYCDSLITQEILPTLENLKTELLSAKLLEIWQTPTTKKGKQERWKSWFGRNKFKFQLENPQQEEEESAIGRKVMCT
jgi:hypothetical protein